jgi:hypothetical protein
MACPSRERPILAIILRRRGANAGIRLPPLVESQQPVHFSPRAGKDTGKNGSARANGASAAAE